MPVEVHPSPLKFQLMRCIFSALLLLLASMSWAQAPSDLEKLRISTVLPDVTYIGEQEGELGVRELKHGDELVGYAYETINVVNIPAYSGKPINHQVILDPQGVILDAYVLHHEEPILLIGIPEAKLHGFTAKYQGISAEQRVVIGRSKDKNAVTIDAVSGATVTVMVVNEIVMRSAHKVAVELGLIEASGDVRGKPHTIKTEYTAAGWNTLVGDGSIRRMLLTRGQVDDSFAGTEAEGVETAAEGERNDPFIDLYVADATIPTIGRNILGDSQYESIMGELAEGDHAILVVANGEYSFKGSGYVRGGIFDRVQLRQFGDIISFRDLDFYRISDVYAEDMPRFTEMAVFVARDSYQLDPGTPWDLELLVRRQTGPVSSIFISFDVSYLTPNAYIGAPNYSAEELEAIAEANRPLWVKMWYQKSFQIGVISVALVVLILILFLQDYLVKHPRLIHNIRIGYLTFTVVFIGWYALGQLSVVNVFTFIHALISDFHWDLFLSDPVIFMLWAFTAASVLLWGRGVFCGWLCPFGALQELINEAARKLKIPQYNVPFGIHERLWAVKYIILLALFGISLESMATAEKFAEVEPFKTAITLHFGREWWFVGYAVLLLVINLFTRKVYCRYICPLGAALAIPTKFRLFDWLKRRKECGNPCQLCAVECEVQAIHPDGHINASECHHCLDCQITYYNDDKCPPLVAKKKRRSRNKVAPQGVEIIPAVQLESKN